MAAGSRQARRDGGGERGHPKLVRERSTKPRRRFRAGRLLAALHRASETLQLATEPESAAWAALVTLTAGEGFAFNRAFLLVAEGETLRGSFGVGPRSHEEATHIWAELRREGARPLDDIGDASPAQIEQERARHHATLAALSGPIERGFEAWRSPFVGRAHHPRASVRRWVEVLDSPALAVIPILAGEQPWGVLLADNFVTAAPIYPGTLEAASTLANALRLAMERTQLLRRLNEEERQRTAAEHVTTLIETARTLAHDLKNPLALAGGLASELLGHPAPANGSIGRELATIANAVHVAESRLAQLIDGLTSRAAGVQLGAIDVAEIVEEVVASMRPLAAPREIRVACRPPGEPAIAIADRSFLERCIENLVGNALQALRTANVTPGVVRVTIILEPDDVRVEVADNGPLLPLALRGEPFSGQAAAQRHGGGLGLVSVRRLVDAMGGRVEYDESEPGWVRFVVALRRAS